MLARAVNAAVALARVESEAFWAPDAIQHQLPDRWIPYENKAIRESLVDPRASLKASKIRWRYTSNGLISQCLAHSAATGCKFFKKLL